ncbi:MAG TPA: DUF4331 family protein [Anaerolineales bacterium]|nr:DUF4331 family protein [Anaerolineales bacterium]
MKKFSTVLVYSFLALALVFGLFAVPASAADHLDAPGLTSPGGDSRLDLTDVYVFQSPTNPDNTVMVMGVNPLAGVQNDGTFRAGNASYAFKIDSDGDAKEDLTFRIKFSNADEALAQRVTIGRIGGVDSDLNGEMRNPLAKGMTGENISLPGGGMLFAGVMDDPFFFDLNGFLNQDFCAPGETRPNFFAGLNISAIVLEVPSAWLGSNNIGVWARTVANGKQIDRMGRPAINTVFIPNNPFEPTGTEPSLKNKFNEARPRNDQQRFRGEVVDTLKIFYGDDDATVNALADILLPDILTVDTSNPAGFLNGRGLADDVIDAEYALVTNGAVTTDCVSNDSAFTDTFPYLAPPN